MGAAQDDPAGAGRQPPVLLRDGRPPRRYKEGAFGEWPSDEADRYDSLPHARLAPLVYQFLQTANSQFQLYSTWEQAVNNLAEALTRLRVLLQPPPARKARERAACVASP
jgi:hypothetical protein